ncbi:MAG: fumarate hydratase C-terminal domain-containing protein [Thermodesulfobacteriota bacterium]
MSMLRYQPPLLASLPEVAVPFGPEVAAGLAAGDFVRLTGIVFTGRDQTHRRLVALLDAGQPLPVDLAGQLLYYVGPSPARPGRVVGAAGPTTSYRMDAYTPRLLACGLAGMLGKGARSAPVRRAMQEHGAVYLATIGGAGAFLGACVKACTLVAFADAGPEAMLRLEVKGLPAVVINDLAGRDYYEMVQKGLRPTG